MSQKNPTNVKEKLTEMKDLSELILDLSYSAVLYNNKDIAKEVNRLEHKMDELIYDIRVSAILGARKRDEAEEMSGILQIAESAEKISNASGDIAKLVLEDIELPPEFKSHLARAKQVITKLVVKDGVARGKSLGEIKLESETGFKVIAIRRGDNWVYDPDKHTVLKKEDVVIARGSIKGAKNLYMLLTGKEIEVELGEAEVGRSCKAGEIVAEMKSLSKFATDLAYSSILFYSEDVAREVKDLEQDLDDMNTELERWVLKSASRYRDDELSTLSGLLRIGKASEIVGDAAMEMSDLVLRGIDLHPVFALAVRESEEIITRIVIPNDSSVVGKEIGDLSIKTKTGMYIVGVRKGRNWIYDPSAETRLDGDDVVIAKGTREGETRLKKLVNKKK